MSQLLWLLPALPFLGFVLNGTLALASARGENGPSRGLVGFLGTLFPTISFVLTWILWKSLDQNGSLQQVLWSWIQSGDFNLHFGFAFDRLTAVMLLFITGIGSLIHLYSIGYMAHDRGFARFFAYLNLFLANMIVLVLGDGPMVTFLGWEGVGLCSYLLIGFWHQDEGNGAAAKKAFLVNRVGDLGFLLGVFILWQIMGSSTPLTWSAISEWFRSPSHAGVSGSLLTAATLLIFLGCTGKSAQIPLLTWLPDAMAGPTPVSALIHAATMVTSGVFLLARMADVFVRAPITLTVIAGIGLATALWAAIAGLVQTDIKKVLAYSTVSQLGFMFLAAGAGAFDVAIFHVFTHAFFKAALFLGAGSVIHALGGEQDMRRMGGLMRTLPVTFAAMLAGWYAILGLPLGAGFWSKDLILEKVLVHLGPIWYGAALIAAVLTGVYMTRMMILVFWSPSRLDPKVAAHAHEAPLSMQIPLWILGTGSVIAGFAWAGLIPGLDGFPRQLASVVAPAQDYLAFGAGEHHEPSIWLLAAVGTLVAFLGLAIAVTAYRRGVLGTSEASSLEGWRKNWTLLFDHVHSVGTFTVLAVSWILDKIIQPLLMGLVNVVVFLSQSLGWLMQSLQRARLRVQLSLSMGGLVLLLLAILWNRLP